MHLGPSLTPAAAPAPPSAAPAHAPEPPRETPEEAARDAGERDAFEKAVRKELDRRDAAWTPEVLPWVAGLQTPVVVTTEQSFAVDAAVLSGERAQAPRSWFSAVVPTSPERAPEQTTPEPELAPVERQAPDDTTVQVLVEGGLAPVQPASLSVQKAVPLVEFPQLVTGQVQKLVKDNLPVTQLDFHITPPHVGPVSLQLTVQNGAVNVQLVALTMQAKQVLEHQTSTIASILAAHHLQPGQIKVVTAANARQGGGANGGRGAETGAGAGFGAQAAGKRRGSLTDDMSVQA